MEKQGETLAFEQVQLFSDSASFLKIASSLLGYSEDVARDKACKDQSTLSVPDMNEKTIVERPGTGHQLSNCLLSASQSAQSSTLREIRADFMDGKLVRVSFRFREAERAQLLGQLQRRFGPGDDIVLTEQLLVDLKETKVHYWRDGDELWLLNEPNEGSVLLVREDLKSGMSLPAPKAASRRGEPVSLDDIGIGKLDLKAPLPTLDLPEDAKDTSPKATDSETASEKI